MLYPGNQTCVSGNSGSLSRWYFLRIVSPQIAAIDINAMAVHIPIGFSPSDRYTHYNTLKIGPPPGNDQ
jgi:hypothetical protein